MSFQDISLGLLFALFGKYEGKQSHGASAAKIIQTNACFRGTTYTNDSEGAQKLRKTYTGQFGGDVFKKKKVLWRKKPNSSDLLEWLKKTIFTKVTEPQSNITEVLDSPISSVPPTPQPEKTLSHFHASPSEPFEDGDTIINDSASASASASTASASTASLSPSA